MTDIIGARMADDGRTARQDKRQCAGLHFLVLPHMVEQHRRRCIEAKRLW